MKRAIVLGGGGSRGSYEMGAWTALRNMGVTYDIACGTSIGSINAALMAQGDYDLSKKLWDTITVEQVMSGGVNLEASIEAMFNQIKLLGPFLKKYINDKGADITPLIKLLYQVVDEEKIRRSNVDLGVVTVAVPSLKPLEITKGEMEKGTLTNYLLASASCFPAFPIFKMEDKSYIDGGYYDNLPIDLSIKMGAEEIVAIDLSDTPSHPNYMAMPFMTYVFPSWPLGSILNFNRDVLRRNETLGYIDTMHAFGKLSGFRYGFQKTEEANRIGQRYIHEVASFEARLPLQNHGHLWTIDSNTLSRPIQEHTNGKKLSYTEFALRGAELCGELLDFDPARLYSFEEYNQLLRDRFSTVEQFDYKELFRKITTKDGFTALRETFAQRKEYLLGCLYGLIHGSENWYEDCKWAAAGLSQEFAGALYLHVMLDE